MKGRKKWQAVVLIVVFVGSGGGVFGWRHAAASPKTTALAANTQLVAVQYGNVVNSVSASGSLSFPNVADLTFGTAGTVKQVSVSPGDAVKKGQVLAALDASALQRSLTQAQVNVATAQTNLTNAQTPYSATDLQKAQNAVSQAQMGLQVAQQNLRNAQILDPLAIAVKQVAVSAAQNALNLAQNIDPLTLAAKQNAVASSQLNLQTAQSALATLQAGPSATDLLKAQAAVVQAQAASNAADAAIPGDSVDPTVHANYLTKVAASQMASANLQAAQDALAKLQAGASATDIARAQAAVNQANVALQQAQQDLASVQTPDPVVIAQRQNALSQAQSDLQKAQVLDPLTIAQRQNDVASAQLSLDLAKENLAQVQAGADPNDVSMKQLQLQIAQSALADAQQNLANATIVAPFDGVVSLVNFDVGQAAGASATAVQVIDITTVELGAIVSETDAPKVKVGQQASLSVDALAGVNLTGKVSVVSLIGRTSSGVVSYPITIQVTVPQGVQIRQGMSTTATVVMQQVNNVLVIPNRAVGGTARNPTVTVVANGVSEVRPVTLGLADSSRTQVLNGVSAGETVLTSSSSSGQQRFFVPTGGAGGILRGIGG